MHFAFSLPLCAAGSARPQSEPRTRCRQRDVRPLCEQLEDRCLLTAYTISFLSGHDHVGGSELAKGVHFHSDPLISGSDTVTVSFATQSTSTARVGVDYGSTSGQTQEVTGSVTLNSQNSADAIGQVPLLLNTAGSHGTFNVVI